MRLLIIATMTAGYGLCTWFLRDDRPGLILSLAGLLAMQGFWFLEE